jgi:hypothetical protein
MWSLTLMMDVKGISEILVFNSPLAQLITWEDFSKFIHIQG